MPRIMKTVLPRIHRSIVERGVLVSLQRSVLLPIHLWQEYRRARKIVRVPMRSDFDTHHGVDTDGDINGWTHLSDLDIPSANWIYGRNYAPIEPERFHDIVSRLDVKLEDFVFVDFGSGKGRALLLASEFPFKQVVGIEFSPVLHQVAQRNIQKFLGRRQSGSLESVCADFLEFPLPVEPSVFFFFDPCDDPVLKKLLARIGESLRKVPRMAYLIYVAPTESKKALLDTTEWLVKLSESADRNYYVYRTR